MIFKNQIVSISDIFMILLFLLKSQVPANWHAPFFFFLILSINKWETLGKLLTFSWRSDEVFYAEVFSLPSGI